MGEASYLNLIKEILENGNLKKDRTGVGVKSIFGAQMRFSLRNGEIPLLTTRKIFWRGIVEELLWIIRGQTDSKILSKQGVKIWNANGSREYLDKLGFVDRAEGDLGPVYGFQWRHYGAEYKTCSSDYTGQGIDQLVNVIRTIRENPDDRRMIVCSWNPIDLKQMALPPCHCLFQFYVAEGELSCQMYQRSSDVMLGVPFNISSYSLLTIMIAHICGLKPGDFIHSMGDVHIYLNHLEQAREQSLRTPGKFPTIKIKRTVEKIDDFSYADFELIGYTPQSEIKMEMA